MTIELLIELIWTAYAVVTGACVGSFINVVVYRIPKGLSIVRPRSACPSCARPIAWYDNIPVLSYLWLRARCRHCATSIAWTYPAVEFLGGVLAYLLWKHHGGSPSLAFAALETALLVALALIDARTFLLPEELTIPLIGVAFLDRLLTGVLSGSCGQGGCWRGAIDGLLNGGAGATAGVLLLGSVAILGTWIARRSGRIGPDEDAMGMGDVVLIGAIGLMVGFPAVVYALFLASVQGAVIGAATLALRRTAAEGTEAEEPMPQPDPPADGSVEDDWQPPARAIPFGPFLVLGALEWMLFGATLEGWIRRLLAME